MPAFPVLLICGPSGSGKSTVGHALFDQLGGAAYVDLDQLGLCHPAPPDDPQHHRLRSRALGRVGAAFRAAGARSLVVSGLVDDAAQVHRYAEQLPGATLTVCRLHVEPGVLRERIAGRGWQVELTETAVRNAAELDGTSFADVLVETTGLSVAEVVGRIRATGWPGVSPHAPEGSPASPSVGSRPEAVPVLWLCGPPAVGVSTVGFTVFLGVLGEGIPVAYADLAQLGFHRPGGDSLRADALGRLWPELHAAGARRLIVVGGVTDRAAVDRYRRAVPTGTWTVCRLTAGPERLTERVLLRGTGGGPPIPGDALRGRPRAELLEFAAGSARIAESLDRAGIGDLTVPTDDLTAAEVAAQVRATTGF